MKKRDCLRFLRRMRLGLCLVAPFMLAACADDEPACSKLISTCDIGESDCQREIFAATACTRGQRHAKMPPIRTISRDQYADELMDEASPEDDFDQRAWGHALGLFGLVPSEQSFEEADIANRVANVAAFYRRDDKSVTVIAGSDMTQKQATLTLSHEFVHALQDQREDLAKFYQKYADTSDASLALRCLTEGEAVALSNLTMPNVAADDPHNLDWERYFGGWLDALLDDLAGSSAPIFSARSLVYPVGGRGVINAYLDDGLSGIADFYRKPRITFRSWTAERPVPMQPESMDCGPPDPPAGYVRRYFDRQGLAGLLSLYAAAGQGAPLDAAQAWVSDWFAVYTAEDQGSDDVAVAWRLRLDSDDAAQDLFDSLESSMRSFDAELRGQEVLLVAAADDSLFSDWDHAGGCETDKSRTRPPLPYVPPRGLMRARDEHPHSLAYSSRLFR